MTLKEVFLAWSDWGGSDSIELRTIGNDYIQWFENWNSMPSWFQMAPVYSFGKDMYDPETTIVLLATEDVNYGRNYCE